MMKSIAVQALSCNVFRSSPGTYLKGHVFHTSSVPGLQQCTAACLNHYQCKSSNFGFVNRTCELNNVDKFDSPSDLVPRPGFSYSGWKTKQPSRSCAEIKQRNPSNTVSGYYTVFVRGQQRQVYCDMENFGGGWSLVVSINASNNDHLQTIENNCKDSFLCVPHSKSNVEGRKMSDEDIIALASTEGTFRFDRFGSTPGTSFYQLPGGPNHFSSSCYASNCARMIMSHHYPYKWESNCKGISVGYKIFHHVFDNHDKDECGFRWESSQFITRGPGRFLYGYKAYGNTGIYFKEEGSLFVR
ncbi:uncharacterized protein LOC110235400 [Exaiptasia diaphana]|uniref:Fibrinogen C-terminal domain-containing protein n=1 Tax=Exaiptasia diaphana TaxID=2652724 RepID=A0A913WZE9_EXADI|nr:uncharacterized protein LOC110235400 [Exaiptasia diaphana]